MDEIPSELGQLSNLELLWLHSNRLTGSIPPELGDLTRLSQLLLNVNLLTGEIPQGLGELVDLHSLWLQNNQLTGAIPWDLADLSNLTSLSLHGNQLTGCVASGLREIENNDLYDLGLPDCAQDGPAPAPEGLGASVAGGTFSISWSPVSGADNYEVRYRVAGSDDEWVSAGTATGEAFAFSPACGSVYEITVRSYGDAATYAAGWGPDSESVTATCMPTG